MTTIKVKIITIVELQPASFMDKLDAVQEFVQGTHYEFPSTPNVIVKGSELIDAEIILNTNT